LAGGFAAAAGDVGFFDYGVALDGAFLLVEEVGEFRCDLSAGADGDTDAGGEVAGVLEGEVGDGGVELLCAAEVDVVAVEVDVGVDAEHDVAIFAELDGVALTDELGDGLAEGVEDGLGHIFWYKLVVEVEVVGDKVVVGGLADLVGGDGFAGAEGFIAIVEAHIEFDTHNCLSFN